MTKILNVSLKKDQITNFLTIKKTTKHLKSLGKITTNKGKAYTIKLKCFTVRDHLFITSTRKVGKCRILKFVTCLRILLILNNRSIVHFCEWGGWLGVRKLINSVEVINGWTLCFINTTVFFFNNF